jgi:hypothetical protein
MPENQRAAQRAHENARRPAEDYDDEGRPAAARAREADAPEPTPGEDRGTREGRPHRDT